MPMRWDRGAIRNRRERREGGPIRACGQRPASRAVDRADRQWTRRRIVKLDELIPGSRRAAEPEFADDQITGRRSGGGRLDQRP